MNIVERLKDSLEYEYNLSFSERKQLLEEIQRLNNIISELINFLQEKWECPGARIYVGEIIEKLDELGLEYKPKELKENNK